MEITLNTNSLEYKELEIEILNDICKRSKSTLKNFEEKVNDINNKIESEKNEIWKIEKEIESLKNQSTDNDNVFEMDYFEKEEEENIQIIKEEDIYNKITQEIMSYEEELEKNIRYYEDNYLGKYYGVIKKSLFQIHNKFHFDVIGSYKTKTNIEDSNIDFIIKFNDNNKKKNIEFSEELYNYLIKNKNIELINFMKKSSFQTILILKFTDDPFKKTFTLFFPNELKFISKISISINEYVIDFPILKPLIRILKEIMYFGKLIDKNKNGITSYLLILMTVSYLQFSFLKGTIQENIGYHFINLLKFYVNFNYINNFLCPNQPLKNAKEFGNPIKIKKMENIKNEFTIIDPFNKNSNLINLNKNCLNCFQKIKDIFQLILFNISTPKKNYIEDMINIAYTYREIKFIK